MPSARTRRGGDDRLQLADRGRAVHPRGAEGDVARPVRQGPVDPVRPGLQPQRKQSRSGIDSRRPGRRPRPRAAVTAGRHGPCRGAGGGTGWSGRRRRRTRRPRRPRRHAAAQVPAGEPGLAGVLAVDCPGPQGGRRDATFAGLTDGVGEQQLGLVGLGAARDGPAGQPARAPASAAPGQLGPAAPPSSAVTCAAAGLVGSRGSPPPRGPCPAACRGRRPVGPLDREPAELSVAHGQRQCVDRGLQQAGVVGEGQQGAAAALDVQGELAVDEHDQGAGLAARPVAGVLAGAARSARAGRRRTGWPGRSRRAPARGRSGALARGSSSARSSAAAIARSRSTAPGSANCAAPRPSTK